MSEKIPLIIFEEQQRGLSITRPDKISGRVTGDDVKIIVIGDDVMMGREIEKQISKLDKCLPSGRILITDSKGACVNVSETTAKKINELMKEIYSTPIVSVYAPELYDVKVLKQPQPKRKKNNRKKHKRKKAINKKSR